MNKEGKTAKQLPYTKPKYTAQGLLTADGIGRELRRIYHQYRRGDIDGVMAGKATYIIGELNKVVVVRELAERLQCLEEGRPYQPKQISEDIEPDNQPATLEGTAERVEP
ncbi:hypothetical protein N9251_03195 [Gammaproteobacteria bacterium]|nr:hypothetical protein [Gammaproteobacteria bacterium]